jgi:hypothetical protein
MNLYNEQGSIADQSLDREAAALRATFAQKHVQID